MSHLSNAFVRRLRGTGLTLVILLSACGGSGADGDAAPTPAPAATPESSAAPSPSLPDPPAPLTCNPGPGQTASTGFSEVFRSCVGTLAVYYPLTECVRDNTTGLIWEGKTATGLRAGNVYFTNFDSTTGNQVANSGSGGAIPERPATQAEINAGNNTVGYINLVNGQGVCGGNWRLPNRNELAGLFTRLDPAWFPNQMNFWGYWSSSVRTGITYARTAYEVEHHGRSIIEVNREDGYFVRLVRN